MSPISLTSYSILLKYNFPIHQHIFRLCSSWIMLSITMKETADRVRETSMVAAQKLKFESAFDAIEQVWRLECAAAELCHYAI